MVYNPRCEVWAFFDNLVTEGIAVCKICKQRLKNDRSFSLRKHMRKLHNTSSEVWKYFDNIVEEGVAVCKTCSQRVRNNRCFNLIVHMRRIHKIEINDKESKSEKTNKRRNRHKDEKLQESPCKIPKSTRKRLYIEMEKNAIERAVLGLMIEEGIAPQVFDSKNMQVLLKPMYEAISELEGIEFKVNETESEKAVSLVANHIRHNFAKDLHWHLLSLKIDMTAKPALNSFSVTAQFISEGRLETRILGVIDLKFNNQLGEKHIKDILHKFSIDSKQITSAFWDNTKDKFNHQAKNSEYLKEITSFESYPDVYFGDIKVDRYMGINAHLCVLDIFKNSQIFQLFLECRNLAKFIMEESNGYYQLFEKNNLKIPQLDSPWKWGSTFTMMHDLSKTRSLLQNVKCETLDDPEYHFNLDERLWCFIDAFCKSVIFIQKTILKCYKEEMHIGDFYAQWLKCKLLTEKLLLANTNQKNYVAMISRELLRNIEKRSKELFSQEHFEACLYLDPRFQHILNLQQKTDATEYLKKLWKRFKVYNPDVLEPDFEFDIGQSPLDKHFDDDEDAFLNEFLCQDAQAKDNAGIYNKIETLKLPFQAVDTNILHFWKEQKLNEPELYTLSAICFSIPATQIYNQIGEPPIYQTDAYTELPEFTRENLLYIGLNGHLIEDAIENLGLFKKDKSCDDDEISEDAEINAATASSVATTLTKAATHSSVAATSLTRAAGNFYKLRKIAVRSYADIDK